MIHEAEESLDNLLSPNGPLAGVIKITDFPLANGKTILTILTAKFQAGSVEPIALNLPLPGSQRGRIPKMFQGTPSKFYFQSFGDIRSNRK